MCVCVCLCDGVKKSCKRVLFPSVQLLSCVRLLATPWTSARQASLSILYAGSLLRSTHCPYVTNNSSCIFIKNIAMARDLRMRQLE